MSRAAMSFSEVEYGGTRFSTVSGDEPGYATGPGEVMLQSVLLPIEAVDLIKSGKAVRICDDGRCEAIEGERAGLIVFGHSKGDRPVLRA